MSWILSKWKITNTIACIFYPTYISSFKYPKFFLIIIFKLRLRIERCMLNQGRLKIWTEDSHWFLLTLQPLEILWQNFQHFYNLGRYEFWPNLKGVAQKLDPPRPLEVFYIFGGKSKFWAPMTLIFCTKRVFIEVDNW